MGGNAHHNPRTRQEKTRGPAFVDDQACLVVAGHQTIVLTANHFAAKLATTNARHQDLPPFERAARKGFQSARIKAVSTATSAACDQDAFAAGNG